MKAKQPQHAHRPFVRRPPSQALGIPGTERLRVLAWLCAAGTRPAAIPILPLAFPTQSRCVPSLPPPSRVCLFAGSHPRGHLVLVTVSYGNVPASRNISTTVRVTRTGRRISHSELTPELGRRAGGTRLCMFVCFLAVIKDAAERTHLFSAERSLSYQRSSWFLSPLWGLIRRLRRGGRLLQCDWESRR